jgi:hypothetical protein
VNKDIKDYLFDRINAAMDLLHGIAEEVSKWETNETPDEEWESE